MRLDPKTLDIIKSEVANQLGPEAIIRLFGSRVDDNLKGGDIDLYIELNDVLENHIQAECKLAARLYITLGGRKVDVLIKDAKAPMLPIHHQAMLTGIVL